MQRLDLIVDFIQKHLFYEDREKIRKYIDKHIKYGTLDYALDDKGNIIAVVRWNVKNEVWEVLDFAVSDEWRNKGIGCDMISRGLKRFPDGKYLKFKRGFRNKKNRLLKIDRVIKMGRNRI